MNPPGAVVLGGYINGLGIVRALGQRGIPTAVVTTRPFDIAHRSRWTRSRLACAWPEDRPDLLPELFDRHADEWRGWAIFPTNDWALAALAEHHERLSRSFRVLSPTADVAAFFLDKERMLGVASAAGVPCPRYYGRAADGLPERDALRFPVVVKPFSGHRFASRFQSKLFLARDVEELERCLAWVNQAGIACGVFDFVPGPDSDIFTYTTYLDTRGEPLGGLTVRKLRQSPPTFGVARLAELGEPNEILREATLEILRRIEFRGMATAEFKRDPRDGTYRLLEINGRSVLYNALLRRGGLDTAGLAWTDSVEGSAPAARVERWPGVWRNAHADLLYSALYRRHETARGDELPALRRRPSIDAVWSATDPLPALAQWTHTAHRGVKALWHGTHRGLVADRSRPPLD